MYAHFIQYRIHIAYVFSFQPADIKHVFIIETLCVWFDNVHN